MGVHEVICALGGFTGPVCRLLLDLLKSVTGGEQSVFDLCAQLARPLSAFCGRPMKQALRLIDGVRELVCETGPMLLGVGQCRDAGAAH